MVTRCMVDKNGRPIGNAHSNPTLDTRVYEVQLEDEIHEHLMANKIVENLYYAQVDDEGREILRFADIVDYHKDSTAQTEENGFIKVQGGGSKCIKTTKGWEMLIEWKDGTSSWLPPRDVKEASLVELAVYAVAMRLDKEPAFAWWIDYVLKKRDQIIKKAKSKYWLRSNKVPALRGYQEISCHIIFDVKTDFTHKARFVANGSTTDTPSALTYSSVVSRDSIRIALLVAVLNDLDIFACDIGNAYLNAPCKERIWFVAGHECGHEIKERVMKLIRSLYGLKSSLLAGGKCARTSPNNSKPDGTIYYELLLVYVDDVLAISHDPEKIMETIGKRFEIKNDQYSPPTTYLGGELEQFTIPGSNERSWGLLSTQYLKAAVANVETMLKEEGREFKTASGAKAQKRNPIPSGYKPELDTMEKCDPKHHSRLQQLIGILRCTVEPGIISIYIEVALMSQYSANPRVSGLLHPPLPEAQPSEAGDRDGFNGTANWAEFYGDVVEEDPPGMPEPLGKPVEIFAFCVSDHMSNVVMRRSHSGILLFAQNVLICSFIKKQNTVEASTYGAELVAMRIARDMIVELRLKLKSIGIPMVGPANVFCNNQGVVKNTSIPESTLSKKHNSANYHIGGRLRLQGS
ncbi:hypothetical protein ACHAWF_006464 [Thalassiosira exigua]